MINRERLLETFLSLVRIDSESREELPVATFLRARLEALGAECLIDDAGERVGGNSGNLFVRYRGTNPSIEPLFFSAHMDTVAPGRGVKPIVDGNIVRTDGTTVLGADDKSGCAILVEMIRSLREHGIAHGDIEICFTICEEVGLLGAKHFAVGRLSAKRGMVFDSADPTMIYTRAPAANQLHWIVRGLESHAAAAPERGISSIRIAAQAIAAMKFGRIDFETTANIGTIRADGATNIVSRQTEVHGEARSLDEEKLRAQTEHMSRCFHDAVDSTPPLELETGTRRATLEENIHREYDRMSVPPDARIVQLVQAAAAKIGYTPGLGTMGGACDGNIFNARGIECVNIGTGMSMIHTRNEILALPLFYRSADVTLAVVTENAKG
jgi:tripeptide aminopeptidase